MERNLDGRQQSNKTGLAISMLALAGGVLMMGAPELASAAATGPKVLGTRTCGTDPNTEYLTSRVFISGNLGLPNQLDDSMDLTSPNASGSVGNFVSTDAAGNIKQPEVIGDDTSLKLPRTAVTIDWTVSSPAGILLTHGNFNMPSCDPNTTTTTGATTTTTEKATTTTSTTKAPATTTTTTEKATTTTSTTKAPTTTAPTAHNPNNSPPTIIPTGTGELPLTGSRTDISLAAAIGLLLTGTAGVVGSTFRFRKQEQV